MRRKHEAVLCFESNDDGLPKVVRGYRDRYRTIGQVLDDNPEILLVVHKDLRKLSEGDSQGRQGDYTSENILRALVVQHCEGLPFRDAVIRIGSKPFLRISRGCEKGPSWTTRSWTNASWPSNRKPGNGSTNCWASTGSSRRPSARTSSAPTRPSWNPTSAIPPIRRSCGILGEWHRGC